MHFGNRQEYPLHPLTPGEPVKTLDLALRAFAVACLSITVACSQPNSSQGKGGGAGGGGQNRGTGDGGGGNVCKGRPIESYAFDVKATPAFQKYIKPIFDETAANKDDFFRLLSFVMESKAWYLIPCELNKLPDEKIGSAVKTEQAAIQTFTEVWNYKPLVEAMSELDQAQLFWHEIFMGIKLLKFESSYNQCRAFTPDLSFCEGNGKTRLGKPSDLTQEDYADVRKAAMDVGKIARPVTWEVWEDFLARRNFSFSRKFRRADAKMSMTSEQLFAELEKAKLLGRLPSIGHTDGPEEPVIEKCQVKFQPLDRQSLEVTVIRENGEALVVKGVVGSQIDSSGVDMFGRNLKPVSVSDAHKLTKGQRAFQATLHFESPTQFFAVSISETVCVEDKTFESGEKMCTRSEGPDDGKYFVCAREKIAKDDF